MSKAQATKGQFDNFFKETNDFGTQYTDACAKSTSIFMKGCEEIFGTMMSLAQTSTEKQSKFVKEALSVKSINEFAEIQNKITQSNFDDFVAGATKISEIGTKVLTDSAEPVNEQVTKVIKKASESVASAA